MFTSTWTTLMKKVIVKSFLFLIFFKYGHRRSSRISHSSRSVSAISSAVRVRLASFFFALRRLTNSENVVSHHALSHAPSTYPRLAKWAPTWPISWRAPDLVKIGGDCFSRRAMGLSWSPGTLLPVILHLGGNFGDRNLCIEVLLIHRHRTCFPSFVF